MKNYIKLVNFEVNRIIKLYIGLLIITTISQFIGFFWKTTTYLSQAENMIKHGGMSQTTFIEQYGPFNMFEIIHTLWFVGPIALGVAAVMIYIFLIWYRDWLGKNTFIYRLLMLPTSRVNVLLAKATTIMLGVFGLVAFQYILLIVQSAALKWRIPKAFRIDLTIPEIINNQEYLMIIMPKTFTQFVLNYGAGITFLFICFTVILFERSFRIKGAIAGILYALFSSSLFALPFLILIWLEKDVYPSEAILILVGIGAVVLSSSVGLNSYLIKRKVTV